MRKSRHHSRRGACRDRKTRYQQESISIPEYRYEKAMERVAEKKKFFSHLTSFLVTNGFLVVFNLVTAPNNLWFYWPLLGWGIGLTMHYFKAFGLPGVGPLGEDWEERELERELRQLSPPSESPLPDPEEQEIEEKEFRELRKEWRDEDFV